MYQIGDYIVKSVTGVCKIKDIASLDFMGNDKKLYYQLMPLADEGAKLYVPVDGENRGIRAVMTAEEASLLIQKIPIIQQVWISNDKERERRYKEAIKSNDPEVLVGILKLIYQRKKIRQEQGKKTTDADKRYFDIAENLLYSELTISMKKNREEICSLIKENCEKCE